MASFTTNNVQNVNNNNNGGDVNNVQKNSAPKLNNGITMNSKLQWHPEELPLLFSEARVSSLKLARDIRVKFQETFHDVCGAFIFYDKGSIRIRLYFEYNNNPLPEGKIHSLKDLTSTSNKNSDFYERNQIVQNKVNGKKYTLNNETRILLSEFMYGGREANRPDNKKWDSIIKECSPEVSTISPYQIYRPNNAHRIFIAVDALNINVILKKLYGDVMITSTKFNTPSEAISKTSKCTYKTRYIQQGKVNDEIIIGIGVINQEGVQEEYYKEYNNFNTSYYQMY